MLLSENNPHHTNESNSCSALMIPQSTQIRDKIYLCCIVCKILI